MTDNDSYYEICIALDSAICAELWDIVASEIADFTNEGLEFAESGAIIIRTSQNAKFINALLAHLQGFCKDLSAINNKNIAFSYTIEIKQNRDWIAEYRRGIKPLRCGKFYIYPPWENQAKFAESTLDSASSKQEANSSIFDEKSGFCETSDADKTNGLSRKRVEAISDLSHPTGCEALAEAKKDAEFATINIMLEPSLAFGTGHHSSTFMCIEAIQALHAQDSLKNKKLLDFGCGSGILALCAEKLGAVVDLCDIDESAIIESKKNFNNNNATISHIWQGGIADRVAKKGGIYDIIMANIIASVLIEQKDNIASHLKRGGIAVLSGILDIYKDEVLARFSDFEPLAICQSDEWICAVLQKA